MCRFAYTVDEQRLRELWYNEDWSKAEIARELGLMRRQLEDAADRYGLGPRGRCRRAFSMADGGAEDENASAESLAFSPWVAARIKELKLGMPA